MNPDRWQAVGDLFDEVLLVPATDREKWLAGKCGNDTELHREVLSLLSSHDAVQGGFVQEQIKNAVVSFYRADATETVHVGQYRLVRELGRGGMGTVYLGERDDDEYRTQVAIKVVRQGMDTEFILTRFRRERQTLARLQHPNIARLLDGGTTQNGLPYIVMEYVDGPAITDYARKQALSVDQVLELFILVCSAIDYAHRNFVVHRDIKPGNILVGPDGAPKLLDFGICKLLYSDPLATAETSAGMLTPDYASPEQVRGDAVTIASDVYSLGAVLYELLTGVRPHRITKFSPQAIERAICDEDTLRPSLIPIDKTLSKKLAGDLDNIVLRAMEKEPERRYASAAQFADDLRRYLDNEPVHARPLTLHYRAVKFFRRNRVTVAAAFAVFLALALGAGLSLREAYIARQRLEQVRSLANKFIFDVHDAVRPLPGSTKARQLILETGLHYLDAVAKDAESDPEFQKELASAYRRIGDVQGHSSSANLGNTPAAIAAYHRAQGLLDRAAIMRPRDVQIELERIRIYQRLANIQMAEKGYREALETFGAGLRSGEAFLPVSADLDLRSELANIHIDASGAYRNLGKYDAALDHARQGLGLFEEVYAARPGDTDALQNVASGNASVGMALTMVGRLEEGLAKYRQGARDMEEVVSRDRGNAANRRELMLAYGHIADVLGNPAMVSLGDSAGALEMYRKAAAIGKSIYDVDHADQRAALDYAIVLSRVATVMPNDEAEAKLAVQRESLDLLRGILDVNPRNNTARLYVAFLNDQMGDVLRSKGEVLGAEGAYRECIAQTEPMLKTGGTSIMIQYLKSAGKLAELAGMNGRRREAVSYGERAVSAIETQGVPKADRLIIPRGYAAMGMAYAALAKSPAREPADGEEARVWLNKALQAWKAVQADASFGPPHKKEMRDVELLLSSVRNR
jgi:tetratricopeptide (TPR) repeat protein